MSYESDVIELPIGATASLTSLAIDDDALTFLAAKLWFRPTPHDNDEALHAADPPAAAAWKLMPVA